MIYGNATKMDILFIRTSVQFSSVTQSCPTLCDPMVLHPLCNTPGFPVHHQLLEFTQTHVHWVSDAIQSSHPLLSPSPPTFNLSHHQGDSFSNESVLHIRWPKYWSFSCSISPFNEYSGLISFRVDWLDLLAVQGTLKSLLQHHSSKASILQHSDFFIAQLSHPYMTTGKTIALTRWIFVGKVWSLLFNMLYMDLLHLKIIFILPFNKYFIAPTRCQEVSHQNSKPILKVNIQKYVVIGFTFKRFPPYTSRYQLKTTNIGA